MEQKNDLTTIPNGIYDSHGVKVTTPEQFNDWQIYENTEFRADENFNESWSDVDKLKKSFGKEVYLITLNEGSTEDPENPKPFRPESTEKKRYTFAFDYAVTNVTQDDLLMIHYRIMKYRKNKIDETRSKLPWNARAMILLARVELEIEKHPHIVAHFS